MPLKSGQLEIVVVIVRRAPEFFVLPLLTRLGLVLCAHSDMACASKVGDIMNYVFAVYHFV
jgi:uncharacterized membrane protein